MIDFNSTSSISGQVAVLVDAGMQRARARQSERLYLGASRLGVACERGLQFEYAKAPIDHGRDIPGRMLRILKWVGEIAAAETLLVGGYWFLANLGPVALETLKSALQNFLRWLGL